MVKKPAEEKPEIQTTGHNWDGITELDTPMPRWWLLTFYATIIFAIGYVIAYPAWPLVNKATGGILGWSSRGAVAEQLDAIARARAPLDERLVSLDLPSVAKDPELGSYAISGGAAIFRNNCSQCHGAGGAGVQAGGYPNLLDDDWLWGGTIEDIHLTIRHGIRFTADDDTRFNEMPAFAELLEPEDIGKLANYVLSLSDQPHDAALAEAGAPLFEENCTACHGENGEGDREQGAPNLTDAIWLFGSDPGAITKTISTGRGGVMPAWASKLSEADIRKVSVYVHELGGGE